MEHSQTTSPQIFAPFPSIHVLDARRQRVNNEERIEVILSKDPEAPLLPQEAPSLLSPISVVPPQVTPRWSCMTEALHKASCPATDDSRHETERSPLLRPRMRQFLAPNDFMATMDLTSPARNENLHPPSLPFFSSSSSFDSANSETTTSSTSDMDE